MSTAIGIIILAEVVLTLFTVWGLMNEKRFITSVTPKSDEQREISSPTIMA